jgi:hypothetical protein
MVAPVPEVLQITPGEALEVRAASDELLVLEARYAPQGAHLRPAQDERFEVLEGVLRVELAGAQRAVVPRSPGCRGAGTSTRPGAPGRCRSQRSRTSTETRSGSPRARGS